MTQTETIVKRQKAKPREPDRYPKADRPVTPNEAEAILDELAELATAAGIELPTLADGRGQIERSRRFRREFSARTETRDAAIRRIRRAIATGELDLDAAAAEAARAEQWVQGSVFQRAVSGAQDLAATLAFDELGRSLDGEAILQEARSIVAHTVAAIRKLRPTLDGIADAEQATAAGPKVAKAWATYKSELFARWEATHDLVRRLRDFHWIRPLPVELRQFARYGRPDLRVEDRKVARRAGDELHELLDPISDRWLPGGPYTESEAQKFARDLDAELGPVEPAPTGMLTQGGTAVFS